ncbi:MAG: hypothetical protein LUD81_01210 [Clostridiales bacterium]|nr:hypothetical protein [Clostridiales bacterium]
MKAYEIRLKTVNAQVEVYDDFVVSKEETREILERLSEIILGTPLKTAEK